MLSYTRPRKILLTLFLQHYFAYINFAYLTLLSISCFLLHLLISSLGGPGCSSLGGMFTENGPFIIQDDGYTIELNEFSWNKVANVIYMEAPAGVGFSYSNTPGDYNTNDIQTANDNLVALLYFFNEYPQFAGRQFFIAGESYAGHYIPELAAAIIAYNQGNSSSPINMAGILVGNGLTNEDIDFNSNVPYFFYHALVSPYAYQAAYAACDNGTLFAACSGYLVSPPCPDACANALTPLNNQIGNLNPYNIYQDLCLSDGSHINPVTGKRIMGRGSGKVKGETAAHILLKNNPVFQSIIKARNGDDPFVPCIDEYVGLYLNRDDVKAAIHANAQIAWVDCNQNTLNYTFNHSSMLPIYDMYATAAPNMRVLIYSGDFDSVLPFLGTEWNVQALNRTITKDWTQWIDSADQPGGYTMSFTHAPGNDLRFLTVRGVGHMVPAGNPQRALTFFSRFLNNQPF